MNHCCFDWPVSVGENHCHVKAFDPLWPFFFVLFLLAGHWVIKLYLLIQKDELQQCPNLICNDGVVVLQFLVAIYCWGAHGEKGDAVNLISIFTFWFCHRAVEGAAPVAVRLPPGQPAMSLEQHNISHSNCINVALNYKCAALQVFGKGNFT